MLPGSHYNLLVYILAFGRELLSERNSANLLNSDSLAFVLSRACMRATPHDCAIAHSESSEAASIKLGRYGREGCDSESQHCEVVVDRTRAFIPFLRDSYADLGTRWRPTQVD